MSNFKCPKCGKELEYFDTVHAELADEKNGGVMIGSYLMYCTDCDIEFEVSATYEVKLTSIDEIVELED